MLFVPSNRLFRIYYNYTTTCYLSHERLTAPYTMKSVFPIFLILLVITYQTHHHVADSFQPLRNIQKYNKAHQPHHYHTSFMPSSHSQHNNMTELRMNMNNDNNKRTNKNSMEKGTSNNNSSSSGGGGILFPPGLIFICSVLLPYNDPLNVAFVFVVLLVLFNVLQRQKS